MKWIPIEGPRLDTRLHVAGPYLIVPYLEASPGGVTGFGLYRDGRLVRVRDTLDQAKRSARDDRKRRATRKR